MRREEYTERILHEWETSGYIGSFVTLTYRDNDLLRLLPQGSAVLGTWFKGVRPAYDNTLSRKEISNFCDKLGKRINRKYGHGIKYIAVGEYGNIEKRSHYHLCVIGLPVKDRFLVYECWNKGRVDLKPLNHGRIRYTLDYIDKQVFGANLLYETYGDFEPPFAHFSKGLGVEYIYKNINKFDEFGTIHYTDTKTYTLPPYYRNKLGFKKKEQQIIEGIPYSDSVIKYAQERHLDIKKAMEERAYLSEQSKVKKEIQQGIGKNDLKKNEFIIAASKLNFNLN